MMELKNKTKNELIAIIESMIARESKTVFDEPSKAFREMASLVDNWEQEHFIVLFYNRKLKLLKSEVVFKGTADASLVSVRTILRRAFVLGATRIIVGHNHPTLDNTPSNADISVTEKLRDACELLDITLDDHIIFGVSNYRSMRIENDILF